MNVFVVVKQTTPKFSSLNNHHFTAHGPMGQQLDSSSAILLEVTYANVLTSCLEGMGGAPPTCLGPHVGWLE